jgi:hypothetical protein
LAVKWVEHWELTLAEHLAALLAALTVASTVGWSGKAWVAPWETKLAASSAERSAGPLVHWKAAMSAAVKVARTAALSDCWMAETRESERAVRKAEMSAALTAHSMAESWALRWAATRVH